MIREYYDPPKKGDGRVPDKRSEDDHLVDFATWMNHMFPDVFWFHVPNENGAKAGKQYYVRQKEKGVRKGVPDVFVMVRGAYGHPYALIEMKRETKALSTPVSEEQKHALAVADGQGAFAAVCYGKEMAKAAIRDFLGAHTENTCGKYSEFVICNSRSK